MIKRSQNFVALEEDQDDEQPMKSYCQGCLSVGINSVLEARKYLPDENGVTIVPSDADQWLQCMECGEYINKKDARYEGRLRSAIEEDDNNEVGTIIESVYPKGKEAKKFREKARKEKELATIKDPDIQKLIRQGYNVVDYSERIE
jgi:hypothetical protein